MDERVGLFQSYVYKDQLFSLSGAGFDVLSCVALWCGGALKEGASCCRGFHVQSNVVSGGHVKDAFASVAAGIWLFCCAINCN